MVSVSTVFFHRQSWYECAVKVSRATYYRTKSIVDQGIFQLPQVGRQNTAQRKGNFYHYLSFNCKLYFA